VGWGQWTLHLLVFWKSHINKYKLCRKTVHAKVSIFLFKFKLVPYFADYFSRLGECSLTWDRGFRCTQVVFSQVISRPIFKWISTTWQNGILKVLLMNFQCIICSGTVGTLQSTWMPVQGFSQVFSQVWYSYLEWIFSTFWSLGSPWILTPFSLWLGGKAQESQGTKS